MLIGGTEVPLPYYARPDLATIGGVIGSSAVAGSTYTYTVAPGAVEICTNLYFVFTASATVVTRFIQVVFKDQTGTTFTQVFPATTQTASQQFIYAFNVSTTFAYFAGNQACVSPLPVALLLAGYSILLSPGPIQSGDQFTQVGFTTVRIPTGVAGGDPRVPAEVPLIPTPLAV